MMPTTNYFDPSLLRLTSIACLSSSSSLFEFKSPARRLSPSKSSGKRTEPVSSTANTDDISNGDWFIDLSRRRAIILTATLIPGVIPMLGSTEGLGVNAAEENGGRLEAIQEQVRKVLSKGKAPGVLRLVFHDAGTFDINDNSGGMNGSIVYELERPENAGLKKSLKILEKVKSEVEGTQSVSWADIIAVAGAEAVSICGGPVIPVQLGRLDSMVPDPEGKLPEESLDAPSLKQCFLRKGFSKHFILKKRWIALIYVPTTSSTRELVALSGAHTIGAKGFGSPVAFDNTYYKILVEKPWVSQASMSSMVGLPSDRALAEDEECLRWINKYATDQKSFFEDFRNAYIKLVNSGASWENA